MLTDTKEIEYSLSYYDYHLPTELIAQHPASVRDQSRLMVLDRKNRVVEHRIFRELPLYLSEGDILVLNNTRVIPARFYGEKSTGGKIEVLLLRELGKNLWEALIGGKIKEGEDISFGEGLTGRVIEDLGEGKKKVLFKHKGDIKEIINKLGDTPLPPYIKRKTTEEDRSRYQTVYAKHNGSAAAPTAGLHFTDTLLKDIRSKGIEVVMTLLHVGLGTFQPVRTNDIREHKMEPEYFKVPASTAGAINRARAKGKRVIAIGTTTVKALETATSALGAIMPAEGYSQLFIYPGYKFRTVDALITNFHLPCTTLLMIICAFAGSNMILDAYKEAIENGYRFYSYGDAMLIL